MGIVSRTGEGRRWLVVATCFGGGGSGGGSTQPEPFNLRRPRGSSEDVDLCTFLSEVPPLLNIYWSTSPDTSTPTWNKIEGATSPFVHDNLTNGVPRFYGVTAVSGSSESDPSAVVGAMPGKWTRLDTVTVIDPQPRDSHTAVYNPTTDRMIIFGGKNQSTTLQDLWVLSNASGAGGNPDWNAPQRRKFSSANEGQSHGRL